MLFAPRLSAQTSAPALYERGRTYMMAEDWYAASESMLECLRINPAYSDAVSALA